MTGFTGLFIGFLRDLRLVPIVLMATIALFALKALGLVLDGGYLFDNLKNGRDGRTEVEIAGTVGAPRPAPANASPAKQSWAQPMFNSPDVTGSVEPAPGFPKPDITGAVGAASSSPAAG